MCEPLVQTQVIPYLRELTKDGHDLTLMTFEPEAVRGFANAELIPQGIQWKQLRYHKRPSVPATAYDILSGARYIVSLLDREKFDVLHARSHVPMLMAALARRWSREKPKIIFDIRGFFPEEYTDAGLWPAGGWLYRSAKRIESWLLSQADGFVVLSDRAREIMFGGPELSVENGESKSLRSDQETRRSQPVEVIPCCVDMERFVTASSESRAAVRSQLKIGDRKVLVYVGAFGGWYLTDEMVDLFAVFKEIEPNSFAMILTQSNPYSVEAKLRNAGYAIGDTFIQKVPAAEIPLYLSSADLAVSFIKNCYSKQASSPTKNAEYLAAGLPIIANSGIGDVDSQILRNGVGAIVHDLTDEAYRKAFEEVAALGHIGEQCRETAKREFDLATVGGVRYRRLYKALLEGV